MMNRVESAWFLPAIGMVYLGWAVASVRNPRLRLLRVTSRRWLPRLIERLATSQAGATLLAVTEQGLRHYRLLRLLLIPLSLLSGSGLVIGFLIRLVTGHPADLLALPAALLAAIVTHEAGHGLLYARTGQMVLSIQAALPLHGQTRALMLAGSDRERALTALAGGAANVLAASVWLALWLLTDHLLWLYLTAANLSATASVLFPAAKDYQDLVATEEPSGGQSP